MVMQGKFHITTKNGRQRALWLRLFGSETLPVTAAFPHEVFYRNGRSELVYDLDTAAIGEHGRRRLAAYIAARHWGTTFEAALRDVRFGWAIDATDCQPASVQPVPSYQNPATEAPETAVRPTVLENGRTRSPRQNSREIGAYGRSAPPQIIPLAL